MNLENNSIVAQSLSENEFVFPFSEGHCVVFLLLNYFLYSKAQDWRYFNITSVSEIPEWKVALQKRGIFFIAEWNALTFQICRGRTWNKLLKHNKKTGCFLRGSQNVCFITLFKYIYHIYHVFIIPMCLLPSSWATGLCYQALKIPVNTKMSEISSLIFPPL